MKIYKASPNIRYLSVEIQLPFIEDVPCHFYLFYFVSGSKMPEFIHVEAPEPEPALALLNAKLMKLDRERGVPGIATDPPVSLSENQDEDDIPF